MRRFTRRFRLRALASCLAACALLGGMLESAGAASAAVAPPAAAAHPAAPAQHAASAQPAATTVGSCQITYSVTSDWGTGFTAAVTVENTGPAITSWTLAYSYAGNQTVSQGWSGTWTQSGKNVSVASASWNGSLGTNASTQIGANFTYSGSNVAPTAFTLNGTAYHGVPVPVSVGIRVGVRVSVGIRVSVGVAVAQPDDQLVATPDAGCGADGVDHQPDGRGDLHPGLGHHAASQPGDGFGHGHVRHLLPEHQRGQ